MGIKTPLAGFITNHVAISTFFAWFIAQTFKVLVTYLSEKKFSLKGFFELGGMPSSHSAGVIALTTSVGFREGTASSLFVVSLMFTIVVLCDAMGVRRSTGQQAEILNQIMEDFYKHHTIQPEKLKELIGHTPLQVLMGMILGLIVALGFQWYWAAV